MVKSTVMLITKFENDVYKWFILGLFVKNIQKENIKVFVNVFYVGVELLKV